jgi:hypothetical protein
MADIRALEPSDVPAVAALLRAHMPDWALDEEILAATMLDSPWRDEETPSLVALGDGGEVIGFVGAQPRRMRFDGREIRGVCLSDLIVDPGHRSGAPGALLLTRLLSGPQELSWSDSTTDDVARLWRTVEGHVDHPRSLEFMLVLKPGAWARSIVSAGVRRQRVGRNLAPVPVLPAHAAGRMLKRAAPDPVAAATESETASAAAIVAELPGPPAGARLAVDWDEAALANKLEMVSRLSDGLECRIVHARGRAIGWYAYLLRPGGVSRVLHVAAAGRVAAPVLDDLIAHATDAGTAVLAGRAEPHLEAALRERMAALGYGPQPVIRARDPELAATLATGDAVLTALDGELVPY